MGWFQDKLRGEAPQPTPVAPVYRQDTPLPAPQVAPYGVPPGYQLVPVGQQPGAQMPDGSVHVLDAAAAWKGGKAAANDIGPCPSCSGPNYMTRKAEGLSRNGDPAPTCFDCGYPVEQFGSATGAGGSAQKLGGNAAPLAGAARQPASSQGGYRPDVVVARVG